MQNILHYISIRVFWLLQFFFISLVIRIYKLSYANVNLLKLLFRMKKNAKQYSNLILHMFPDFSCEIWKFINYQKFEIQRSFLFQLSLFINPNLYIFPLIILRIQRNDDLILGLYVIYSMYLKHLFVLLYRRILV